MLGATSRGVGLSPDSLQYLSASESVNDGMGLTTYGWDGVLAPLTHFPPGYPLVLAAAARAGWSPQRFARWSNVALFALTIGLAATITRRMARESSLAAPIAAGLFAVAHDLVVVHSMAWTEPLYLTLTLVGLLTLASAIDRRSIPLLAVASALAGLSALVRYVGVANVGVAAIAVMLWWPTSGLRRIRVASMVAMVAVSPLLATVPFGASGSRVAVADRQLLWHPIGAADLHMAAAVVGKWVSPLSDASFLTAVWLAALLVLVSVVVASRGARTPLTEPRKEGRSLWRVLVLYAAMYMAVLVTSMSFADAQTLFDPRLLVPMLAVTIILAVVWLARSGAPNQGVRFVTWTILALVMVAEVSRLVPWMRAANSQGLALRRLDPTDRALVSAARRLPASARIYSNRPYFLRVQTARRVRGVPRERDPNSLLPNLLHAQQVQAICESAATHLTYLLLFEDESEDPTANANAAAQSGAVERVSGGAVIRVRPRCRA